MTDFSQYAPAHADELRSLLESPQWQEALNDGLVDKTRSERLRPGKTRNFQDAVLNHLMATNRPVVQRMIAAGSTDERELLAALARWPLDLGGRDPLISFLGLNLTPACNLEPRCAYCNQPWVKPRLDMQGWKRIIAEVTANGAEGPYVYLTGGEPLVLGADVWGDDGLIRFATERGAGVNVNTNATLITPLVALALIRAGLLRLHISLDTCDPALHAELRGSPPLHTVLRGIYNVQLARDLVGVTHPGMHTNCVLTRKNLDRFPELLACVLRIRKNTADPKDPLFNDLFPHVIPVGGTSNESLRPTAGEFRRFYEDVWPRAAALWQEHQAQLGVPEADRQALFGYFSNPFLRVAHRGGLDAYVQSSARGRYGELALAERCYVAPTQAAFTPDGTQFRCGSHAIRHVLPLGDTGDGGVYDHIRAGIAELRSLPDPQLCHGCALATLYINQDVEKRLKDEVHRLLVGAGHRPAGLAPPASEPPPGTSDVDL